MHALCQPRTIEMRPKFACAQRRQFSHLQRVPWAFAKTKGKRELFTLAVEKRRFSHLQCQNGMSNVSSRSRGGTNPMLRVSIASPLHPQWEHRRALLCGTCTTVLGCEHWGQRSTSRQPRARAHSSHKTAPSLGRKRSLQQRHAGNDGSSARKMAIPARHKSHWHSSPWVTSTRAAWFRRCSLVLDMVFGLRYQWRARLVMTLLDRPPSNKSPSRFFLFLAISEAGTLHRLRACANCRRHLRRATLRALPLRPATVRTVRKWRCPWVACIRRSCIRRQI